MLRIPDAKTMKKTKLHENRQIRSAWNEEKEEWFFSALDVAGILTERENPNNDLESIKKARKR